VTPEAARFLEKARTLLDHADIMLSVNLNDDAGRTAYLAGFHAAQAFIFEHMGKALKTHKGVQTEFLPLTKDDPRFSLKLRGFLSQAYNLKAIADYETGPGSEVSAERAIEAVETGKQFAAYIAGLLSAPTSSPGRNPSA
jgi:uncharacterized protein (UPF0332 family)